MTHDKPTRTTDILDRLYTRFDPRIVQPDELSREAHAEIERLRFENSELRARVRELQVGSNGMATVIMQNAKDWFPS